MPTHVFGDFEWETSKAAANLRKYGISFPDVAEVFDDPDAVDAPDLYYHDRFVIIGRRSSRDVVPFVVHAARQRHGRIRITSAREASPAQRNAYDRRRPRRGRDGSL